MKEVALKSSNLTNHYDDLTFFDNKFFLGISSPTKIFKALIIFDKDSVGYQYHARFVDLMLDNSWNLILLDLDLSLAFINTYWIETGIIGNYKTWYVNNELAYDLLIEALQKALEQIKYLK